MRKTLSFSFCGILAASILLSNSFAQTSDASANNSTSIKSIEASILFNANNTPDPREKATTTITPKVQKSFTRSFKGIENAEWYTVNKDYLARFIKDGREYRTLFSKNGYVFYSLANGTEKSLPSDVRRNIKSNYVDYNIGKVTEVNVNNIKAWIINLQDEDNIVIARVIDGDLDEMASFTTHPTYNKKGRIVIPK